MGGSAIKRNETSCKRSMWMNQSGWYLINCINISLNMRITIVIGSVGLLLIVLLLSHVWSTNTLWEDFGSAKRVGLTIAPYWLRFWFSASIGDEISQEPFSVYLLLHSESSSSFPSMSSLTAATKDVVLWLLNSNKMMKQNNTMLRSHFETITTTIVRINTTSSFIL